MTKTISNFIISSLVLVSILYPVYLDSKNTISYQFAPGQKTNLLEKRFYYPGDSPIINWKGRQYWLINQMTTHYSIKLVDRFEKINLKIYYQSDHPEKIALETNTNRTKSQIDISTITVLDELNNPDWHWNAEPAPNLAYSTLYKKPGLPEDFPSFYDFIQENTELHMIHRAQAFIVKNDQNIDYVWLSSNFDLTNIAYILLPNIDELLAYKPDSKVEKTELVLELQEQIPNDKREKYATYDFRIICDDYQPGNYAIVEKIEITLERKPVTIESLKQYFDKITKKISGST